jgi:hypothetical protein
MNEINISEIKYLKSKDAINLAQQTTNIDVIIELTKHESSLVRKKSLVQMCPCRVKKDIDKFWDRVFEMVDDSDPVVRHQVLHTLCDGSPKNFEHKIVEIIELKFNRDEDAEIRRKVHIFRIHFKLLFLFKINFLNQLGSQSYS